MHIHKATIITVLAAIMSISPIAPAHARNEGLIMLGTTAVVGGVLGYLAFNGNPRATETISSTATHVASAAASQAAFMATNRALGGASSYHSNSTPSYYGTPSSAYVPQYYVAVPRSAYQR